MYGMAHSPDRSKITRVGWPPCPCASAVHHVYPVRIRFPNFMDGKNSWLKVGYILCVLLMHYRGASSSVVDWDSGSSACADKGPFQSSAACLFSFTLVMDFQVVKLGVIRLLGRKIPALLMLLCERGKAFRGSVTDTIKVMNDSLNYLGLLCLASKALPGCVATSALFSHAISLSGGRRICQVKTVAAASGVLKTMLVTPLCFFALRPQWPFTMVCVPARLSPQVFCGERHVSAQHQGPTVAPWSCLLALPCSGLVDAAAGATTAPTAEPWVLHERKNKKLKIDQKDKGVGEGADDDGADDEADPGDQ